MDKILGTGSETGCLDSVEKNLEKLKQELAIFTSDNVQTYKYLEHNTISKFQDPSPNLDFYHQIPDGYIPSADPQYWYHEINGTWFDCLLGTYSYYDQDSQSYIQIEPEHEVDKLPENYIPKNSDEFIRLVVETSETAISTSIIELQNNELYIGRDKPTRFENYLRLPEIIVSRYHAHIYYKEYSPSPKIRPENQQGYHICTKGCRFEKTESFCKTKFRSRSRSKSPEYNGYQKRLRKRRKSSLARHKPPTPGNCDEGGDRGFHSAQKRINRPQSIEKYEFSIKSTATAKNIEYRRSKNQIARTEDDKCNIKNDRDNNQDSDEYPKNPEYRPSLKYNINKDSCKNEGIDGSQNRRENLSETLSKNITMNAKKETGVDFAPTVDDGKNQTHELSESFDLTENNSKHQPHRKIYKSNPILFNEDHVHKYKANSEHCESPNPQSPSLNNTNIRNENPMRRNRSESKEEGQLSSGDVSSNTNNEDSDGCQENNSNDKSHGFYVIDCGSTLGTFLNGARLSESKICSKPSKLRHLDTLVIGSTVFKIHIHHNLPCTECSLSKKNEATCKKELLSSEPVHYNRPVHSKEQTPSLYKAHKEELKDLKNKYTWKSRAGWKNKSKEKEKIKSENDKNVLPNDQKYVDRAAIRRNFELGTKMSQVQVESLAMLEGTSNTNKINQHIEQNNMGYKMLSKLGWKSGLGLGTTDNSISEPILATGISDKGGLGTGSVRSINGSGEVARELSYNKKHAFLTYQRYNNTKDS